MRAVISKWGNSPAIRLPKGIMESINLTVGQVVEIVVKDDHIEIHKKGEFEYDLEELLAQIEPGVRYHDVDFGPPVGKEVW